MDNVFMVNSSLWSFDYTALFILQSVKKNKLIQIFSVT